MDLSQVAPESQERRWTLQYCGTQGPDGAAVGIPPALSENHVIRGSLLDESTGPAPGYFEIAFRRLPRGKKER